MTTNAGLLKLKKALEMMQASELPASAFGLRGKSPKRIQLRGGRRFYILCCRDFEILGARDLKREEGERLIFWPLIRLQAYLSPWITADSPP